MKILPKLIPQHAIAVRNLSQFSKVTKLKLNN